MNKILIIFKYGNMLNYNIRIFIYSNVIIEGNKDLGESRKEQE